MKPKRFCAALILFATALAGIRLAAQGTAPAPLAQNSSGPHIQVDSPSYDFGKAPVGEKVHHTYIVKNTGNLPLIISNVHPSCGCTTVGGWTTNIPPGQSGEISVQFDTSRYGGGPPITKTIEVYSNSKNDPRKTLLLRGTVWKPIEVTPSVAVISIPPDATNEMTATVRIVNHSGNPVTIFNAVSAGPRFTAVLKEITPGKEYELAVTSHPPYTPGNAPGTITVNTSMAGMPTIRVPVTANVAQPIQIFPSQITLPTIADRWITNRVTIHGNSTNTLVLSNPKATDSRIQIEVRPMGPKGMYNLLVAFPPGFQIAPGRMDEVTIDSNFPRSPVIKIPIRQYPRRTPFAAMAPRRYPPPVRSPVVTTNAAPAHP